MQHSDWCKCGYNLLDQTFKVILMPNLTAHIKSILELNIEMKIGC